MTPAKEKALSLIDSLVSRRRNYRKEVIDLTSRYKYVVFYGCGIILDSIIEKWNQYIGRPIDFCCDRDSVKWGKIFAGCKCISPEELISIKDECALFVTIGDFGYVYNMLKDRGFPSVNLIYKYDLMTSEFLAHADLEDVKQQILSVYDLLQDKKSHAVFWAILNRVLGDGSNPNIMLDVCENNQYFPSDIIHLSNHERLVDIGAYNGDTVSDFLVRTQGRFDHIFAFEVDASNYKKLDNYVQGLSEREKIRIYNAGVWDSECEIRYSEGDSQSTIGHGGAIGHAVTLDGTLLDEKVTYIKMDIEGAELRAIKGSANIIKSQKPKMAVCIYHDFRHLWEIPHLLKSLVPEYRIYLRHHTSLDYETVCYAIV